MGEHGLMMRDEMVRAMLRKPGDPLRKFVTRRTSRAWEKRRPGDVVWIKECWAPTSEAHPRARVSYRADGMSYGLNGGWASESPDRCGGLLFPEPLGIRIPFPARWRPSVLMPRWASRMARVVASIREEAGLLRDGLCTVRLPHVDDDEARREGVADRDGYLALWESINGPEYPEVLFRIEFEEVSQ